MTSYTLVTRGLSTDDALVVRSPDVVGRERQSEGAPLSAWGATCGCNHAQTLSEHHTCCAWMQRVLKVQT